MSIVKPVWTNNVVLRSAAVLTASEIATHDLNFASLTADEVKAQINVVIGSSTGITVKVFTSSDGGTTFDTDPLISYNVTSDDIRTLNLSGPYKRIEFTNDDIINPSGNVSIVYSWVKWINDNGSGYKSPVLADFTTQNLLSDQYVETSMIGRMTLVSDNTYSGRSAGFLLQNVPSAPWKIQCKGKTNFTRDEYPEVGLVVVDSVNDKQAQIGLLGHGGNNNLQFVYRELVYSTYTDIRHTILSAHQTQNVFLEIEYNSSNFYFRYGFIDKGLNEIIKADTIFSGLVDLFGLAWISDTSSDKASFEIIHFDIIKL